MSAPDAPGPPPSDGYYHMRSYGAVFAASVRQAAPGGAAGHGNDGQREKLAHGPRSAASACLPPASVVYAGSRGFTSVNAGLESRQAAGARGFDFEAPRTSASLLPPGAALPDARSTVAWPAPRQGTETGSGWAGPVHPPMPAGQPGVVSPGSGAPSAMIPSATAPEPRDHAFPGPASHGG